MIRTVREITIRPQTSRACNIIFLGHKTGSHLCSSLWAMWRPSEISRPHWQRSSKDHARLSISHRCVCICQSWWTKRTCARCHTNGLQTKLVIGVCISIYHTRLSLINGPPKSANCIAALPVQYSLSTGPNDPARSLLKDFFAILSKKLLQT